MGEVKAVKVILAIIACLMTSIAAGIIFSATGKTALESLLYAGGAFLAALTVAVLVMTYLE
ncbi:hypothetical protein [Streptomyces fradiae]|uniref:hypothetical protein n=1 Tax=Streptomyces fradiae TaxID=1906 RepID=UPI003669A59E